MQLNFFQFNKCKTDVSVFGDKTERMTQWKYEDKSQVTNLRILTDSGLSSRAELNILPPIANGSQILLMKSMGESKRQKRNGPKEILRKTFIILEVTHVAILQITTGDPEGSIFIWTMQNKVKFFIKYVLRKRFNVFFII